MHLALVDAYDPWGLIGGPVPCVAELNQVEDRGVKYFVPCQTFLNEQDLNYMTDLDVGLTLLNVSYI